MVIFNHQGNNKTRSKKTRKEDKEMKKVVCYKVKKPMIFGRETCDTFLAYYSYKTVEEIQKEVDRLNKTHPAEDICGNPIDWNEVDFFFVKEQDL